MCRHRGDYQVKWVRRTRKDQAPRGADARDRALFDKLRDHLFRVDDFVACVRCRRRFEIPSHQTMIFIERGREGAGPIDVDDDNFGNR